jgi:hypothetical protein
MLGSWPLCHLHRNKDLKILFTSKLEIRTLQSEIFERFLRLGRTESFPKVLESCSGLAWCPWHLFGMDGDDRCRISVIQSNLLFYVMMLAV